MPNPFQTSTNALFDTRVARVLRLSPGFVRITLTGDGLERFADHGRDQRIKVMVPGGPYPPVFDAAVLHAAVPHGTLLHEAVWQQRWKDLPPSDRPVLRSYTPSAVRPSVPEVDLDFYVHERPGPASSWAVGARTGERLLISGPDKEAGNCTESSGARAALRGFCSPATKPPIPPSRESPGTCLPASAPT